MQQKHKYKFCKICEIINKNNLEKGIKEIKICPNCPEYTKLMDTTPTPKEDDEFVGHDGEE